MALSGYFWTPEQVNMLARMRREGARLAEIAAAVGRSELAVKEKLRQIGKPMKRAPYWTREEEERLSALMAVHGDKNAVPIAREMGRGESAVRARMAKMVLARPVIGRPGAGRAATAQKVRPCMCCGVKFHSAGAHNRLCGACRRDNGLPAQWEIF